MIPAGQFVQQVNRHACYFMALSGTCKKTGGSCVQWNTLDECEDFVLGSEVVRRSSIEPKLLELIDSAEESGMVFVEHGDPRFTDADIRKFIACVDRHPALESYIVINKSHDADSLITIYSGVKKSLFD